MVMQSMQQRRRPELQQCCMLEGCWRMMGWLGCWHDWVMLGRWGACQWSADQVYQGCLRP